MAFSLKTIALKIILVQFGLCFTLSTVLGVFYGAKTTYSLFVGSFAYFIPNVLYISRLFRKTHFQAVKEFVAVFFVGEVFKLLFSALIFIVVIKYFAADPLMALIGFGFAVASFWVVTPFAFKRYSL